MIGRRVWFHLSIGLLAVAIVGGTSGSTIGGGQALAATEDPREVKGRALFAQGEYQSALELFAALYAEHRDPIYLRNIGRCHQKLSRPTKAIDAFEEYLRRSPRLKKAEREEIEAFIKDMKELKAAQAVKPEEPTRPPPVTATPLGTGTGDGAPPTVNIKPRQPPPSHPIVIDKPADKPAESKPLTEQWWFWAGVGGAVLVSTAATLLIIRGGGVERPPCDPPRVCPL